MTALNTIFGKQFIFSDNSKVTQNKLRQYLIDTTTREQIQHIHFYCFLLKENVIIIVALIKTSEP